MPAYTISYVYPPPPDMQTEAKPVSVRHKFSKEEDELLINLVKSLGENNWVNIAQQMKSRTPRQCRERYKNYLSPDLKNDPWTEEEEKLLEDKYMEYGPKWSKISIYFDKRSDVNVKNHWAAMHNRKLREQQQKEKKAIEPKPDSPPLPVTVVDQGEKTPIFEIPQATPNIWDESIFDNAWGDSFGSFTDTF